MTDIIYGDEMHKVEYAVHSIDKVLDFIERGINNPTKEDVVENLVDVHAFLTKIRSQHISKNTTKDTLPSDLLIYSNMITDAFNVVFGEWHADITIVDDRVIIANDVAYMDVNMDTGAMECIISFSKFANPVIVAEIASVLKDIFGIGFKVSGELFVIDEAVNEYVWGDEEIAAYLKRINGVKVKPIQWFEGDLGNC